MRSLSIIGVLTALSLALAGIARVELYAKDSRLAILADGTKLPVSRAGYQRLQQLL